MWDFPECHGPSKIVNMMNVMDMQPATHALKAWKELILMREGRRLGTLHDVRNSYQMWKEEKKLWDARRKGHTPTPAKSKKWDHRDRRAAGKEAEVVVLE